MIQWPDTTNKHTLRLRKCLTPCAYLKCGSRAPSFYAKALGWGGVAVDEVPRAVAPHEDVVNAQLEESELLHNMPRLRLPLCFSFLCYFFFFS